MTSQTRLVQTMGQAARAMRSPRNSGESLAILTRAATQNIPGVDHASFSAVDSRGRLTTLVPSDQFVAEADKLQSAVGEGPCLDAATMRLPLVRSDDLAQETRWPAYAAQAASMGVGSQLAMHLYDDNESFGGFNLYFDQPGAITEETVDLAEIFAIHASLAMGHAREVAGLNQALVTRTMIGRAVGIVMERYQLNEDRAFEFLVRVSQTDNVKLRAVAEDIVNSTNTRTYVER